MTKAPVRSLPREGQRRLVTRGLLRALASTTLILTSYVVAPLHLLADVPVWASLPVALLVLLLVATWQVVEITRDPHPGVRAIEALAVTAPLFLVLFAVSYVLLSQGDPASFSVPVLTKTDALYFTITTFATVGFGDIAPTSQAARRVVTGQMVLDLLVLGFGIRVFVGAVQRGRHQQGKDTEPR
ncbi:MAG TPA: potassium channel family protein [Ornithinibacter sp.]|nr:potassium channel family protein [Ornithinibacter sp.]